MIQIIALPKNMFLGKIIIACLAFTGLTAVKTYPLILHFHTHILDHGDSLLNTWILAWDFHILKTNPLNLFNANILYPAEHALAFSEHMIGVLPVFAPFYALTGNPILHITWFYSYRLCCREYQCSSWSIIGHKTFGPL